MALLNQYFLYLSRNDMAQVSYFPGRETATRPETDWLEELLMPAVCRIANRRAKNITSTPVGFWICIRETARIPIGEIFVFSTPWRAGKQIEEAVRQALASLPQGNIFQGTERLPDDALPYCQVFRRKVLRSLTDTKKQTLLLYPPLSGEVVNRRSHLNE